MLQKSETNNAIITRLCNIREHPNADRLKLATILGTQVVVGLDAKEGDLVIYFDSNLKLSYEYLHWNNLYSDKELNADSTQKGYFGKKGRVRAQRFRGEISNGYVASLESLFFLGIVSEESSPFQEGDEFTSINGIEICSKYIVDKPHHGNQGKGKSEKPRITTDMFWKHWDTKQLMRELDQLQFGTACYVEEKIHGSSGRTSHVLFHKRRKWYQFWKPKVTSFWKVVSGTRRRDSISGHMKDERGQIHEKLSPHVHKGEELYYEIYGYQVNGKEVQSGYPYDCVYYKEIAWDDPNIPLPYKVVLYRVTITTPDGFCIDLDRGKVYSRANELGLESPMLLACDLWENIGVDEIKQLASGRSALDAGTLREGVVIWFKNSHGDWKCLKHKSEEFLLDQDKRVEKGEGDVEDVL